jgi:alkaline phosphatase D
MHRSNRILRVVALAAGLMLTAAARADVTILASSTFDNDAEGWTTLNDARNFAWTASGGNPGGSIGAADMGTGETWYYVAPAKFLGDQSAAFGGTLSYEIRQAVTSSPFDNSDVLLVGGGLTLSYEFDTNPGTAWTPYAVDLVPSAGWRAGSRTGPEAEAADFQTVLADLDALYIRGEYRNGASSDNSRLDNVFLAAAPVPEPETIALLAAGLGLVGLRLRRRA